MIEINANKKQKIAPNLFSVVEHLEKHSILLATNWIKEETVKLIFFNRKISAKKFRDIYGIPIIEYFIFVVREGKDADDCPVMSKFVNYMVAKGITPREVYVICMGFRKTMISFLLKDEYVLKKPALFMDEIALLFDANLAGVLEIFTNLYAMAQKKIEIAKSQKEKLQQTLKIINSINTKIIIVQNGRIILANKPFLEMIGAEDLKALYLKYKTGFEFLGEVNLFENEYKNDIVSWIEKVCASDKPFKTEIHNEKANKRFNYSGRITSIPVDEYKQYIITFSNISELVKDEKAIKDALIHDTLTGFKNYPSFEHLILKMIEKAKNEKLKLFLAIVDIPDLREINEAKGRSAGDKVLTDVAEDLRILVNKSICYGRLEGSRFGALLEYSTEQISYDWCVELLHKMNERSLRKTVAITEVDLAQSVNKLFLRAYSLMEAANNSDKNIVFNDFKNIIEYEELDDQKEFTSRLAKIKEFNLALFYMELPIISKVKILSLTTKDATIVLSYKQIRIAKVDMLVYFKLEHIGGIKAYISDLDKESRIITIDRFRKEKNTILDRKIYRVEADKNIKAYISDNDVDYDVKLIDINNRYVAIEIGRKRNLDINSFIFLDMLLPLGDDIVSCKTNATITKISSTPNGYKMVLLCHLDDATEKVLTKYILKKQMDIIHTLQS